MNCECKKLPSIVKTEEQKNQLREQLIFVDEKQWVKLWKCKVCGQHWQTDEWDKYQTICAIKIDNLNNWQSFDDNVERLKFLIEMRGGLREENCLKANCQNKALKSLVFCPQHAYELGLRE